VPSRWPAQFVLDGRQEIPFICGDRQQELLPFRRGETDLTCVRGVWYLSAHPAGALARQM